MYNQDRQFLLVIAENLVRKADILKSIDRSMSDSCAELAIIITKYLTTGSHVEKQKAVNGL